MKWGVTTPIAIAATATPATAMTAPGTRRRRARAYQTPERGDDERDLLLAQARRRAKTANGDEPVLVEVPEREEEERVARATGWNSFSVSHWTAG